jgi:EAL and modified HD-GYP domain-containing signal transduction protein
MIDERLRIGGFSFSLDRLTAAPTSAQRVEALQRENVVQLAQRRTVLLPLELADWQTAGYADLIAPHTLFLLTAAPVADAVAEWLEELAAVRASGARLALSSLLIERVPAALAQADAVVVRVADYSLEGFERTVQRLRTQYPALLTIADGVTSWPAYRFCKHLGVAFCIGPFAEEAECSDQENIGESRLVIIEMLNLLRREADMSELVAVAKRDPSVTLQLITMVNSPAAGLSSPIASLDQAILVLGRESLYRWLSLSMFRAGGNDGLDEALLAIALRRGRFLELLGQENRPKNESDELFLVGMFSLLDCLLRMPMDKVLQRVTLPEPVAQVLLRNEGPYGRYLMLAMGVEKERFDLAARLLGELGLTAEALPQASQQARQWADAALVT